MKRVFTLCAAALTLTLALPVSALAAETAAVCYPTSVTRSEDGTELKKIYDLAPEEDPAGIPRSDFEQDGFRYTLTDLLKQDLPEHEESQHTETVSLPSKNKDMASVLALLPQEREFVTDDGLMGTLTLKDIDWQTDNTATSDGYALGDRFTAVATYTGSATSSYVKGYTVTADYTGTVSRIALNRTRYVAISEGTPLQPVTAPEDQLPAQFNWAAVLVPFGIVALAGAGLGRRSSSGAAVRWTTMAASPPDRRKHTMKRTITAMLALCLSAGMVLPASALEYAIDAPDGPEYGKPTSVEVVHTADGGDKKNEDVSKNAALIPPGFGTPSMDARNTGAYLTPNLAPSGAPATGAVVNGSGSAVVTPGSPTGSVTIPDTTAPSTRYTDVTDDLYYKGGYLATLKIPAIGLTVKVYEGTDSKTLAKGAGHFEDTSIWRGNIALAAHNRGVNNHFGQLHTLEIGDKVTLTTKLGTKTYEVVSVEKVNENDTSGLNPTANDQITMYTCVRNQRDNRWKVVAAY